MKALSQTRLMTLVLFISVAFLGCQKEDSGSSTPAEQEDFAVASTESDAEAEVVFDDVFNDVMGVNDQVALGGTGVFGGANRNSLQGELVNTTAVSDSIHCFTVTITKRNPGAAFPVKVVIDYGTGCTGRDGKTRKGKVITEYTNRLLVPQAVATTTFDGYFVNDIKVEGKHKITNRSTPDRRIYHVLITNAKLSKPNGDFSLWNSEKTITQSAGLGTPYYPLDDIFMLTGGANGSVKKGDRFFQWATSIGEPLVKKFICRWFVKGTISFRKSNSPVALLDFGAGDCDNKATLSVNGQTRIITLH